jgi:hypothetical protein
MKKLLVATMSGGNFLSISLDDNLKSILKDALKLSDIANGGDFKSLNGIMFNIPYYGESIKLYRLNNLLQKQIDEDIDSIDETDIEFLTLSNEERLQKKSAITYMFIEEELNLKILVERVYNQVLFIVDKDSLNIQITFYQEDNILGETLTINNLLEQYK